LFNPSLEAILDRFSLKGQGTNLMVVINLVDLILEVNEFLEFLFEIFELRVLGVESLKALVNFLFPKPVILLERVKEFLDVVLGTLDGTCKQKDNLDDFLILSNPIVEWFSLILRLILLVPVLNVLG